MSSVTEQWAPPSRERPTRKPVSLGCAGRGPQLRQRAPGLPGKAQFGCLHGDAWAQGCWVCGHVGGSQGSSRPAAPFLETARPRGHSKGPGASCSRFSHAAALPELSQSEFFLENLEPRASSEVWLSHQQEAHTLQKC